MTNIIHYCFYGSDASKRRILTLRKEEKLMWRAKGKCTLIFWSRIQLQLRMRSWEDQMKMLASATNLLNCLKIARLMARKTHSHKVQERKSNVLFYFILFVFSFWYQISDAVVYVSKTVPPMHKMKVLASLGGNLRSWKNGRGHLNTV